MSIKLYLLAAFSAGACIAIQAAMNAKLGQLMNNSLLATGYAFFTSFLLVGLFTVAIVGKNSINVVNFAQIPWYLWLSCIFSVIGVGSLYFLIPKIGVGNVMSLSLCGQLILAMLINHYGWLGSSRIAITNVKIFGAFLLIAGVILITREAR